MRETKAIILAAGKGSRMKSDLPKVLHTIDEKPMIQHIIDKLRELGIEDIILVVGYKKELIKEALGNSFQYAVQEEQLGTGHAVRQAQKFLQNFTGKVLVLYGDMPLINTNNIRRLMEICDGNNVKASFMTITLDNPPDFGRVILRSSDGRVEKIVEVKDATPDELRIKEVNVGVYCFACAELFEALKEVYNNNSQREYYLTDVIEIMAKKGLGLEPLNIHSLEETLGTNDLLHLDFARKLTYIHYAESLYELIDAILSMRRKG